MVFFTHLFLESSLMMSFLAGKHLIKFSILFLRMKLISVKIHTFSLEHSICCTLLEMFIIISDHFALI